MNNKILLNTGLFAKKDTEISIALQQILDLGVRDVEIGLSFVDVLMNFRLSQDAFSLLKKFDYVGLHAPVNFYYRNDRYTAGVLEKLKQVCNLVEAKYVVFHTHCIEDFSIFTDGPAIGCLENDRNVYELGHKKMAEILNANPKWGFVLDTAHAMSFSDTEVGDLIGLLKDRIVAVHLSARVDDRDHIPLHVAQDKLEVLKPVLALKCPVVLESWHTYRDDIDKEIEFVKSWH